MIRILVLLLEGACLGFAAILAWFAFQIWRECGRLPVGQGEVLNRLLGLAGSC